MDAPSFRMMLVKAGKIVSIMRPSTTEQFSVNGATAMGAKDYEMTGDVTQDGVDYTLSSLDFEGQLFTSPTKGDRIIDGSEHKVIDNVKEMVGMGGTLYGWRCRIVG